MKKSAILLSFAALGAATQTAWATNGYWSHGYGPKSKSMAGACVAMPLEGMCNAINPAGAVFLGNEMELDVSFFMPDHGFVANPDGLRMIPPGEHESTKDLFLIPSFNYNYMLDADSAVSLTIGGNGGMNTEYDSAVWSSFNNPLGTATSPTGIDLMQGFIGVNYARKINQDHAIGIMPFMAIQGLKTYGLEPFQAMSQYPDSVSNNGYDISYGFGARIGWMGNLTNRLTLGASYQTRSWMTDFEDYKGLLAEQGSFDIPPNLDLGLSFKINPSLTLALAYQRIFYSDIKALSNSTDLPMSPDSAPLGSDNGTGFGWDDVDVFKVGLQWAYSSDLVFRAGYSNSSEAFESSQALMNVLAPAVVKEHFTIGASKLIDPANEVSLAVSYAPEVKLYGTNDQIGGQSGYLYMSQWDVTLGWTKKF